MTIRGVNFYQLGVKLSLGDGRIHSVRAAIHRNEVKNRSGRVTETAGVAGGSDGERIFYSEEVTVTADGVTSYSDRAGIHSERVSGHSAGVKITAVGLRPRLPGKRPYRNRY